MLSGKLINIYGYVKKNDKLLLHITTTFQKL